VILQPLLKVRLALGGPLLGALLGTLLGGRRRSGQTSAPTGKRRRSSEQHKERRAEVKAGWAVRFHDKDDALSSVATVCILNLTPSPAWSCVGFMEFSDAAERYDAIVGIVAICALIGSIVLLSKSSSSVANPA
jgi:hypothetical protein